MKKLFFIITMLTVSVGLLFAQDNVKKDEDAIKKVITTAYVNGLLNAGDLEPTKKGFHPEFKLLGLNNNKLSKYPIADWIKSTEKRKADNPDGPKAKFIPKFPMIDITGKAAIVKIELKIEGKHKYTDYLSLYKFDEGWKIVSKIYCDHDKM
jgi:hypothetical protein